MSVINVRQLLRYSGVARRYLTLDSSAVQKYPKRIQALSSNVTFNAVPTFMRGFADQATNEAAKNADTPPPPSSASDSEKTLKSEIDKLNEAIGLLTEKKDTLEDKYKRSLADSENLRTRLTKQIEDAKVFGIQSFCKDLLEVADVLSKATESVPKEELTGKNPHLKSLYEGLVMTEAQLQKVFKRHGLEAVNPLEEKFDPNLHEALFQQEVPNKEAGVVIHVSKVGYKLRERCIRPALVGVSKTS